MIAVAEPQDDKRTKLRKLMAWLSGSDHPIQVKVRPYCSVHRETLMEAKHTRNGTTYYYCPCEGCRVTWKGRGRVV